MASALRRIIGLTALPAILLAAGACASPHPSPPVTPETHKSVASAPTSPTPTSAAAPQVIGPAPKDLHDVDWTNTPVPGEFCGVPDLVRFDANGRAKATSGTWGPVLVSRGLKIVYGDSDADHRDEAAVFVGCGDDKGGNEQLAAGYVVFTHVGDRLAVIGSITPRKNPPSTHPPYSTALTQLTFARGRIIVYEKWWRTSDPHCCPSGNATTIWTWKGDRLIPGDPHMTS